MTELTETEYRTLRMKTLAILGELGARDNATATAIAANLVPTVEAILRERVAEALSKAAAQIEGTPAEDWGTALYVGTTPQHGFFNGANAAIDFSARIVREAIA